MKFFLFVLLVVSVLSSGCAAYKQTGPWAPDGFNLTDYHELGTPFRADTVATGLSWTLK